MRADKFMVRLVNYGSDADLFCTTSERRIQGVADEERCLVVLASDHDAAIAALTARVTELESAARAVVARWDTPLWKDVAPTAEVINALRNALADGEKQV